MALTLFLNKYRNLLKEDINFKNGSECSRCCLPYNLESDCNEKCCFEEDIEYYFSELENFLEDEIIIEYWNRKIKKFMKEPYFVFSTNLENIESCDNNFSDIQINEDIKIILPSKTINLSISFLCNYTYSDGFIFQDIKYNDISSTNDKDIKIKIIEECLKLLKDNKGEFIINILEDNKCLYINKMIEDLNL